MTGRKMRAMMFCSVGMNIALLAVVMMVPGRGLFESGKKPSNKAPEAQVSTDTRLIPEEKHLASYDSVADSSGSLDLYEKLRGAGLSDDVSKRLLVSELLNNGSNERGLEEYWKPAVARLYVEQRTRFEVAERVRRILLSRFGEAAKSDQAFIELFAPLNNSLPFLSGDKQLAVERLKLEAQKQRFSSDWRAFSPVDFSAQASATKEFERELSKLLTEDELFNYRLRDSPQARMLAASGFDFSEKEFRDVFRAISESSGGSELFGRMSALGGAPTSQDQVLSAIKKALGEARFVEYRRLQDPVFRLIGAIAKSNGLPPESVARSYQVLDESNTTVNQIRQSGPILTSNQKNRITEIIDRRDSSLKEILGNPGFSQLEQTLGFGAARSDLLPKPIG